MTRPRLAIMSRSAFAMGQVDVTLLIVVRRWSLKPIPDEPVQLVSDDPQLAFIVVGPRHRMAPDVSVPCRGCLLTHSGRFTHMKYG